MPFVKHTGCTAFILLLSFSSSVTTTDRLHHLAPSLASSITPALCIHVNVPILSANTLRPAPYRKSSMDSFVFLTASSYVVLTLKSPCWLVNLWSHLAFLVSHKHSFRFLHKGWQHNVGIMSQSMMTSCHLICYLHISVVTAEKIFTVWICKCDKRRRSGREEG